MKNIKTMTYEQLNKFVYDNIDSTVVNLAIAKAVDARYEELKQEYIKDMIETFGEEEHAD